MSNYIAISPCAFAATPSTTPTPLTTEMQCSICNKTIDAPTASSAAPTCELVGLDCYRENALTADQINSLKEWRSIGKSLLDMRVLRDSKQMAIQKRAVVAKSTFPNKTIKSHSAFAQILLSMGLKVTGTSIVNKLEALAANKETKVPTMKLKGWTKGQAYPPQDLYGINRAGLVNLCKNFGLSTTAQEHGHLKASGELLRKILSTRITEHVTNHGTSEVVSVEENEENASAVPAMNAGVAVSKKKKKNNKRSYQAMQTANDRSWCNQSKTSSRNTCSRVNAGRSLKQQELVGDSATVITMFVDRDEQGNLKKVRLIGVAATTQQHVQLFYHVSKAIVESNGENTNEIEYVTSMKDIMSIASEADKKIVPDRLPSDAIVHPNDSIVIVGSSSGGGGGGSSSSSSSSSSS